MKAITTSPGATSALAAISFRFRGRLGAFAPMVYAMRAPLVPAFWADGHSPENPVLLPLASEARAFFGVSASSQEFLEIPSGIGHGRPPG